MKAHSILGKIVLLLAVGLAPVSAHCGTVTGTIASITYSVYVPNSVFINMSNTITGAPACAATQPNRMLLDLTVPAGKAMYAHLLAMRLTNPAANITLIGTNACTLWSDTENIRYTPL